MATDAIVLGGGLMGSATAFFLARRGVAVTLIERARIGSGATVASFGNIRRTGRDLSQLPLAHRSRRLWGEAERLLGRDVEFRATGHLRLVFDEEGLEDMRAYADAARPLGLELEELDAPAIARRFPGIGPDAIAASLSPRDGSANPRLVPAAFAAAAVRLGARVIENVSIARAERTGAGFRVPTAAGDVAAEVLVNCAGAWGAGIAENFGEPVPLSANGPQMGVTEPLPPSIRPVVGIWTRKTAEAGYLRQVERGNVVFGGAAPRVAVPLDSGRARVDPDVAAGQMRAILRLVPALRHVAVIRRWSGCEGYIADGLPVMGPSSTTPGLFHAFGFCGHGFQLGPGVGDAMAELVATGACETPLAPFHVSRFATRAGAT
ncbi:MAG: FAD-binding oxidoreductase [Hyphomicrobiaceae bacterium]